jgi:hypothetical protein
VLNITGDELWGVKKAKSSPDLNLAALWRRLKIVETFTDKDRKAGVQFVEVIAKRNKA